MGNGTSHTYPNHRPAKAIQKEFPVHQVLTLLSKEHQDKIIEWMKRTVSLVLGRFNENATTTSYEEEADLQFLVQLGLEDNVKICRKMLSILAEETGKEVDKIPDLVTRREKSIFSNIVDHTIILERKSNVPIFSIETKKFFHDAIHADLQDGGENRVYGQSFDQLRAMKKKGHPSPFAAICSFQETYITWLDNDDCNDDYEHVLNSHGENADDRLWGIANRLTNGKSAPALTQSPPKGKIMPVVTPFDESLQHQFVEDQNRQIVCSARCYKHCELVPLFVNATFCALDAVLAPRSYMKFVYGTQIKVDAIQIKEKSYGWGVLTTTLKEPLKWKGGSKTPDLFLVEYLDAGSTSVIYRAVTADGCDCVVKMLVGRQIDENNDQYSKGETDYKFDQRTLAKVESEIKAYNKIYGKDLDGYVWMQRLNGINCVVMPFFSPIEKDQRSEALEEVKARLKQFGMAKMIFEETDQLWRHVGRFENKIFLFDLGDLKELESESDVNAEIDKHYQRLSSKATATSISGTTNPTIDA